MPCGARARSTRQTTPQAGGGAATPPLVTIRVGTLLELAVLCRQRLEELTPGGTASCPLPQHAQFPPAPESDRPLGDPDDGAAVGAPARPTPATTPRPAGATARPASPSQQPKGGRP